MMEEGGGTLKHYNSQSYRRSQFNNWQTESDEFWPSTSQAPRDETSWRRQSSPTMEEAGGTLKHYNSQSYRRSQFNNWQTKSDEFWPSTSQAPRDETSWRRQSSPTNGPQSWRLPSFRRQPSTSEDSQSWRRPSSFNEEKLRNVAHNSEPAHTQACPEVRSRVTASAMKRGKVLSLDWTEGYGFLSPLGTASKNVYFRFVGTSSVETGMLQLEAGDVFEFISNESPDKPRAIYACLVECNPRCSKALAFYLDTLLSLSQTSTRSIVLRHITKCPAGFLQVLNFQKPPFDLVYSVLELVNVLSHHDNEAELYNARLKQFHRLFCGTALLQSSLKEYSEKLFNLATTKKLLKEFLICLVEQCPETVSDVLPLLKSMVLQRKSGEYSDCHCQFLLGMLAAQVGNAVSATNPNLPWNKTALVPEITDCPTDEFNSENCLKGLPCVKKKGSYGSIDVYMDTYFRLLHEDCFWGLRKGISDLRKKSLPDPREMRIGTHGLVMGIHFGGSYSGITVALQVDGVENNMPPMSGSLLCLSDDGGNFDSPIWGVVAHCEVSNKRLVIFAEIMDGRGSTESQAIGRLLMASPNIVLAESPTFYKAYQPVLKALQEKDKENFPFTEELVFAEWPNSPPDYLGPSTSLNWRCLFKEEKECSTDENRNLEEEEILEMEMITGVETSTVSSIASVTSVQGFYEANALRGPVDALDNLLKSGHKTSLDGSQIEAIKLALSNRLVLIQGPPGTGKSYVGVKILELILTADNLPHGPILVMTYKNHGLDQFLISCLKFCPDLVRVGGRSEASGLIENNLASQMGRISGYHSDWLECTKLIRHSKILELILTADNLPHGPILVMTYKNHGLDQFLISCLKFCPDLVRVGGRSEASGLIENNLASQMGRISGYHSDWLECKVKLEELQTKIEIALRELLESNVFNVRSVIDHMPDKQVRQLLCKTECGTYLLGHIPEEISLREYIRDGSFRNIVTSLLKILSKSIREWMPKAETFEAVENSFSVNKTLQRLYKTGYTNTRDIISEDVDRTIDLEEYEEETSLQSKHETKHQSWLEVTNFFSCRREANDSLSSGGAKLHTMHIDLKAYQWLLHENPWDLNEHHRVLLVHLIKQANYEKALKRFADKKQKYAEICEVMKETKQLRQLEVLRGSRIVGMTTTGAALYSDVLKKLRPSIVFVEEASEILEPQLLAVLEPTVQHLILFGDQYQLSPRVACHELERWHDFGISMFERLVEHNKMPFQSLSVQGRMREEFVPMLLPIYPYLRSNTKLVTGERNGSPACMMSPMYFWSHSYPEIVERSAANDGEATMVVTLLRWMIAEGEDPSKITILTAYGGQVSLLRKKLETFESTRNVQVHTIDRFQGSENKTVVVSLVRSNEDGNIGFLAKRNRLCVSVSRARGAVYFCGSCTTFSKKSPHWKTLLHYFQDRKCLGEQIYMRCPRHPSDPPFTICSSEVNSFNPLLCDRPCKSILNCNHQCESTCHHGDHPECKLTVQFLFRDCGHEATKQCSEKEEKISCKKEITYTFEACQHTDVLKCWRVKTKSNLKCMQVCPKKLECGHPCTLKCYENCKANPCSICVKIKKEQAAKEKLREAEELKQKLKELENEIERLKLQHDTGETSIIELDSEGETAAEYFQVSDRTEKFIQPVHGILPIVTKIEKVCSLKLQIKFVESQRHLISPMAPTQLLFHGSSNDGIQGIVESGFRLPPADKRNMFGQGIYFATDSSKSAQTIYSKGSNKLLLCDVLLGKTWTVQNAQAELDKKRINKKGYDSLFSKRKGKETGGTLYDEFVVYDPHQAIPRYIVHYKNLISDPAAMPPSQISADQNLTRIQYKMSSNFTGDSPEEYHFRLAESQFFRMSKRNDYKVVMVELIINKTLQRRYETAKEEFAKEKKSVEERLVFHGTEKDAIEKIIEEGFKIGGEGVAVLNGTVYGSGVYTALDPNISIPYSRGGSMMLLSSALVGEKGKDYNDGASDVLVLKKAEYLLPKYIVHFAKK